MNLRKHIAGFALFTIIVGCAIFINAYLRAPIAVVPYGPLASAPMPPPTRLRQPVNYKVRLVSLDFINQKSYTVVSLKREAGQPTPEKLWVTTILSPDISSGKIAVTTTEIFKPFANSNNLEYTATSSCDWCKYSNAAQVGYFAHVYVSPDYNNLYQPGLDDKATTAVPVVVQAIPKVTN